MSPPINRPFIDPTCPSGGSFYVCSDQTRFLGCCEVSACAHACSAGAIQPASFNASFWGNFSDQQCSAGRWFTCAGTNPPFMGCCKTNPCSQGRCPQDDLAPAHLSNNSAAAADFLPPPSVPSLSSATSSASASTAAASNITDQKTTKGVIIGASIGGAAGLILSLALLGFLIHRSKAKSRNQLAASQDVSAQVTYPETTQIGELDDGDESKHSVSNCKHKLLSLTQNPYLMP